MRLHHAALIALSAFASTAAMAADYPVLRGTHAPELPPPPVIEQAPPATWDGFYVGGLVGAHSTTYARFTGPNELAANVLRNTTYEQSQASQLLNLRGGGSRGHFFGGYIGYNLAYGDVVVGIEGDVISLNRRAGATDLVDRIVPAAGRLAQLGSSETRLQYVYSLRGRAGYAMGNFMPYVTGGFAFGHGTTTNTLTLVPYEADNVTVLAGWPQTFTSRKANEMLMGYTLGAGVEAMFGGLILRGEYLYTRLKGQGGPEVEISQGRFGAGVKF